MLLIVQLIHPGYQKPYVLGTGYQMIGNRLIREWNNDRNHYRKFIQNNGKYVNGLNDRIPKSASLFFWGEWEGNSFFEPINNPDYRILPNGIHEPFHSIAIRGSQNTDPYVFGKYFKYCTCGQTGQLCELDPGSMILFGTTYPTLKAFYLDAIFIVKSYVTAVNVCNTGAAGYTQTYKEETLEQLDTEYLGPNPSNTKKLYHSQTWWDNNEHFSFVPIKLNHNGDGFERLRINFTNPLLNLSKNTQGRSYLSKGKLNSKKKWEQIIDISLAQGYLLGIRFDEPNSINIQLPNQNQPITKG